MFHRVHLRLTLLFSVVTAFILLGMSFLFLYIYTQNLKETALSKFQNDMAAFKDDLEISTSVSYEWLMSMQKNYGYDFYIYDNEVPFRFVKETKSERQMQLIDDVRAYFDKQQEDFRVIATQAMHKELEYHTQKENYFVGRITIPGKQGNTFLYVIYPLAGLRVQIQALALRAVLLLLASIVLLFLFSWFYTKRLLKPIQQAQERQTQFIAAASHEVRNPVNTILSALSAMEKGDAAQQREFVLIAQNEGKRLRLLTEDLLTLARGESQSFPVSFGEVQLDTILLECYEAFTASAKEKAVSLRIELPESTLKAEHMDGARIRQVVSILLDNALSYTPGGGTVILRGSETARQYRIEVIDNGIGIGNEQKKHIFERFYRADASRGNKSHFGLGLCIAKEIVTIHGGGISVKDTPGGGASFLVCIPKQF